MYTRIRLLLLIRPIIFSFSNIQTLKIFITLFSGTVRPRRLKLGAQVDNGWMYRVYWNQAAAAYLSLYFYVPHRRGEGQIVFGADPVGVGVSVSVTFFCLHDISLTGRWILTKFAWM